MKIKQTKNLTFYSEHLLFRQSNLGQWQSPWQEFFEMLPGEINKPPLENFILVEVTKWTSKESPTKALMCHLLVIFLYLDLHYGSVRIPLHLLKKVLRVTQGHLHSKNNTSATISGSLEIQKVSRDAVCITYISIVFQISKQW